MSACVCIPAQPAWTPDAPHTLDAGLRRVERGSRIVAAVPHDYKLVLQVSWTGNESYRKSQIFEAHIFLVFLGLHRTSKVKLRDILEYCILIGVIADRGISDPRKLFPQKKFENANQRKLCASENLALYGMS